MDPYLVTGVIGATMILFAFILNQFHIWSKDHFVYDFTNLAGSILLIIYAISLRSYPFIILNTVWALVSCRDCVRGILKKSQ